MIQISLYRHWNVFLIVLKMSDLFKIDVTCVFCNKTFQSIKRAMYCSYKCNQAYRRLTGANSVQVTCPVCGKHYTKNNKFAKSKSCSQSCTMKLNKLIKSKANVNEVIKKLLEDYFTLGNELIRMNEIYTKIDKK